MSFLEDVRRDVQAVAHLPLDGEAPTVDLGRTRWMTVVAKAFEGRFWDGGGSFFRTMVHVPARRMIKER